jgi:Glycoside hydrolase 123, catalytic domain/Glycoside hydrolase 123 N-terminal domain
MIYKYSGLLILTCLITNWAFTQDLSFSKSGKNFYSEMANPVMTNSEEWAKTNDVVNVSFASDNVRYPKEEVPLVTKINSWNATSWKGEKVHTQILVWSGINIKDLSFQVEDLVNDKGQRISSENMKLAFVRYVMADEFGGGCNKRKSTDYDSSLVADPIDIIKVIPVLKNTVQPIWLSIQVPGDITSGVYTGTIIIKAITKYDLKISVNVLNHTLPPASQWRFDLDLWQYPAPIARIHDVKLWSNEHFKIMRPYFTALANAGQKVITANIINQPWGNTHVYFDDPSLIKWIKKKDGSWEFDYSLFDKYISFIMSCGIKQRINCYTMVTWDLSFSFYDEESGKDTTLIAKPGSSKYHDYWTTMLTDFTEHLKSKGWFGITAISMDERPLESMQTVIKILRQIDPEWKIALAGDTYHPEIEQDIYDYSIASYLKFDEVVLARRKKQGMPTTFYTACKERHPGPYTFSPPSENAWLGWHAAAKGYTGYLFWAYNSWVKNPLLDSRFRSWPSGTCYQFYPGPRTSIRFEKLIEGIQDYEKIRILRENFLKEGNGDKLKELDEVLSLFDIGSLDSIPAADMLIKAKKILNSY